MATQTKKWKDKISRLDDIGTVLLTFRENGSDADHELFELQDGSYVERITSVSGTIANELSEWEAFKMYVHKAPGPLVETELMNRFSQKFVLYWASNKENIQDSHLRDYELNTEYSGTYHDLKKEAELIGIFTRGIENIDYTYYEIYKHPKGAFFEYVAGQTEQTLLSISESHARALLKENKATLIIGLTQSYKKVYAAKHPREYPEWTPRDHQDASKIHLRLGDPYLSKEHTNQAIHILDNLTNKYTLMENMNIDELEKSLRIKTSPEEDFDIFKLYIVERSNGVEKNQEEAMMNRYGKKITSPSIKELFQNYYTEVKNEKKGIFSFSNTKEVERLANYLADGYQRVTLAVYGQGAKSITDTIRSDQSIKLYKLEAESLLKGAYLITNELKQERIAYLKEVISERNTTIVKQAKRLTELERSYGLLTKAYDTLVSNVKKAFNVTDEKMRDLRGLAKPKEQDLSRGELLGIFTSSPKDQSNYPAGVSESEEYHIYRDDKNTFAVYQASNDPDGRSENLALRGIDKIDESKLKELLLKSFDFDETNVGFTRYIGDHSTPIKNPEDLAKQVGSITKTKSNEQNEGLTR